MYESNEERELYEYLSDPDIRHLYIDSSTRQLIAMQIQAMRESKGWLQQKLGDIASMKQSAITRLEDPRYGGTSLSTLKRLAKAFDVALIVKFATFSDFISMVTQIDESFLSPPSFDSDNNVVVSNHQNPRATINNPMLGTNDIEAYIPDSNNMEVPTTV